MTKTLIITEKPSVARDIARVLKVSGRGEGFLQSPEYVISWAVGHLLTLCEPDDYNPNLKRWSMATLPILPTQIRTKPVKKTEPQLKVLLNLLKSGDTGKVICATDSGREGELIFRYIYNYAKCTKPVSRLWISSMTDEAIKAGLANLKPASDYDNLYHSALCRSHSDWLVGINASRAYSITHNANYSVGRVQTPTLAMIVARQAEIDAFVPEEYWEVFVDLFSATDPDQTFTSKWFEQDTKADRLQTKELAAEIVKKIKGKEGLVKSVGTERKGTPPPLLHDLADLQREANKKHGFAASKTLTVAQSLYEKHKCITYPRTDSRHLSADIKLVPIINTLAQNSAYSSFAKGLQPTTSKRVIDASKVTDHHAIIPTTKRPSSLTADEAKIYDLVCRRFLAAHFPAHLQDMTQIITIIEGESFISKGAVLVELGWKVLYTDEQSDKDNQALPEIKEGETLQTTKVTSKTKKTTPPKPYTEATLLSAMENCGRMVENEEIAAHLKGTGLGTAATRAATIERLLQVEYIIRKGKALHPTDKGKQIIAVLPHEITSPETTGKWEKGLHSINGGTMEPERFMKSIHKFVEYLIAHAQNPGLKRRVKNDKSSQAN